MFLPSSGATLLLLPSRVKDGKEFLVKNSSADDGHIHFQVQKPVGIAHVIPHGTYRFDGATDNSRLAE